MGSTLLRSPGSSNPAQYIFNGIARSACPAACARPSIYAAKRFSCGPGAECLPTKQFYTNLFLYNTVVLDVTDASARNGGRIQQWDRNSFGQQLWQFIPVGAGYYKV